MHMGIIDAGSLADVRHREIPMACNIVDFIAIYNTYYIYIISYTIYQPSTAHTISFYMLCGIL